MYTKTLKSGRRANTIAWNFDASLSTNKDYVRFLIGDTNTNAQLVADETIVAILSNEANKFMAAAAIVEALYKGVTSGGSLEDRKVGETRIRYQRITDMLMLVGSLRMRGAAHMKPSAGGIYQADTDRYDADASLDKPEISKHIMDNPRASRSVTSTTT